MSTRSVFGTLNLFDNTFSRLILILLSADNLSYRVSGEYLFDDPPSHPPSVDTSLFQVLLNHNHTSLPRDPSSGFIPVRCLLCVNSISSRRLILTTYSCLLSCTFRSTSTLGPLHSLTHSPPERPSHFNDDQSLIEPSTSARDGSTPLTERDPFDWENSIEPPQPLFHEPIPSSSSSHCLFAVESRVPTPPTRVRFINTVEGF